MKSTVRILLWIALLSLVLPPLAAVSEAVIPFALMMVLIFYPGSDASQPRLLRWMPFIWAISFLESSFICIDHFLNLRWLPVEMYAMVKIEDALFALISTPVLIWLYLKNKETLRIAILICAVLSIALSAKALMDSSFEGKAWIDFAFELATESILAIYLRRKLRKK